jgi:hypothetical protein
MHEAMVLVKRLGIGSAASLNAVNWDSRAPARTDA